jgi:hypothetical protein
MPAIPLNYVQVMENEGEKSTLLGGLSIAADESETVTKSFELPENLHVQGAHISWVDCKVGDKAQTELLLADDTVVGGFNINHGGTPAEGLGLFQLVGTSRMLMYQPNSITALLVSGMKLRVTLTTTSETGTRCLGVNFIFRRPL